MTAARARAASEARKEPLRIKRIRASIKHWDKLIREAIVLGATEVESWAEGENVVLDHYRAMGYRVSLGYVDECGYWTTISWGPEPKKGLNGDVGRDAEWYRRFFTKMFPCPGGF